MNKKDVLKAIKIDMPNKVDKVEGKGLSTNDYTTTDKQEVAKVKDKADKSVVDAIFTNGITPTSLNAILGSEQFPFKDIFVSGINKSENGYTKVTNGYILQFGTLRAVIPVGGVQDFGFVNLPIIFPNAFLSVSGNMTPVDGVTWATSQPNLKKDGNARMRVVAYGVAGKEYEISWMAIGR